MHSLYYRQIEFQRMLTKLDLPHDNPLEFRNHICLMLEELGELCKTDKRWRKTGYLRTQESGNKIEEIADVFIVAMNLAIYSGYKWNDILSAIDDKISYNYKRLESDINQD